MADAVKTIGQAVQQEAANELMRIERHAPAAYVEDRLRATWSPEHIAGYLRRH
jgi:IS30 family transposase